MNSRIRLAFLVAIAAGGARLANPGDGPEDSPASPARPAVETPNAPAPTGETPTGETPSRETPSGLAAGKEGEGKEAVAADPHQHSGGPAPRRRGGPVLPLPPADTALVEEGSRRFVSPLESGTGTFRGYEEARKGLANGLRLFISRTNAWAAEREKELPKRLALIRALRDALAKALAPKFAGGDGSALASKLVASAVEAETERRTAHLHQSIMCWCPAESWTRTLEGCTEGCADPQKYMVEEGLAEGATDEEIIRRIEADPRGGPRVRAVPEASGTNLLGYLVPLGLFAAGAIAVAIVLSGRKQQQESTGSVTGPGSAPATRFASEPAPPGLPHALPPRAAEGTSSASRPPTPANVPEAPASGGSDDWDARIERELKELDR